MKKNKKVMNLCVLMTTLGLSIATMGNAANAAESKNENAHTDKLVKFEEKLKKTNPLIPEAIEKQLTESVVKADDDIKNYCNQTLTVIQAQNYEKNLVDLIAKKCVLLAEQEKLGYELQFGLKKIEHNQEDFKKKLELIKDIKSVKNLNTALKGVREASLLRENETKEFERVGILFKNPDISLNEKKKEEKNFYQTYSSKNYKVSKEVYEGFKGLNNALIEQKDKVIALEKFFHEIDMQEIKKSKLKKEEQEKLINQENKKFEVITNHPEKSFQKEIVVNSKIFENYDTYLLARKMNAEKTLNNIVELKKVKLTKQECELLDVMNKGYEIKTFKNLTCK